MRKSEALIIGTAGWAVPSPLAEHFAHAGTHLARYASRLNGTEINSSFHRPHRVSTYERWAAAVPDDFRFAVKMHKEITHVRKLVDCVGPLERFLVETSGLGGKRHVVLVQLPPRLAFESGRARAFFEHLRANHDGHIAFEPRHPSWFVDDVDDWLESLGVSVVAADPAIVPQAGRPRGWRGMAYFRWHGSPRMYYDKYSSEQLRALVDTLVHSQPAWCIFDNTAAGHATSNALSVTELLPDAA